MILLRQGRYAEVKDAFRQINATDARIVVLSCETFDDLSVDQLMVLRDAIGNNPCEFVYYCRRWSDRIPSDWKQSVKMGRYENFPDFYGWYMRHPVDFWSVNYSGIWGRFSNIFGRKSLRLVSYSYLVDRQFDMVRHFTSEFLNWKGETNVPEGLIQRGASPNAHDTEILRALNWLDYQKVNRYRPNMRIKFTTLRSNFDTQPLCEIMAHYASAIEIDDSARSFREPWRLMAKYSDQLVTKTIGPDMFQRRTASVVFIQSHYLLRPEAAHAMAALYEQIEGAPLVHPDLK